MKSPPFFRFFSTCVITASTIVSLRAVAPYPETPYSFTTVAGVASAGSADGPGASARLNFPAGIAVDAAGNLYIADSGNHTIRKIDTHGVVSTLAGKAGYRIDPAVGDGQGNGVGSAARFTNPIGMVVDAAGNLFVSGADNAIRKITPDGTVTTVAGGNPISGFNVPQALAIDSTGNLYVADTYNSVIKKISPAGVVTLLAGGSYGSNDGTGSAAQFMVPKGIAVDASGTVYVADMGGQTIRKITPGGVVTTFSGTPEAYGFADGQGQNARFNSPAGLAIDAAGNLYVADSWNFVIRLITPSGLVTTYSGAPGMSGHADGLGTARFYLPWGVAVDAGGTVFVTDARDNTVRVIPRTSGNVVTLAGISPFQSLGSADGAGATARFRSPDGLAVGPAGEIYAADLLNHTIRKITASGSVSTFAGTAGALGYADGTGPAARFNAPAAVAADGIGNVYVADRDNNIVRKITPAGAVSTFAGRAGIPGQSDGPALSATFGRLSGIAVDRNGNVYVADAQRVRKIGTDGQVSSLPDFSQSHSSLVDVAVDSSGNIYAVDESYEDVVKIAPGGAISRILPHYFTPRRIAVDAASNVFVTDSDGDRVWKLSTDGTLSIIGGLYLASGSADDVGELARFDQPAGVAVDANGAVYVSCAGFNSNIIRKGVPAGAPVITAQPQNQIVAAGGTASFSVTASGTPEPSYQWSFNGTPFIGATNNTLTFTNVRSSDAGSYTVVVTNPIGTVTSNHATLSVPAGPATLPSTGGSAGGGGGGGGAPSGWFFGGLLFVVIFRLASHRGGLLRSRLPRCITTFRGGFRS